MFHLNKNFFFLLAILCFVFFSCNQQKADIDPVAALYSNTQVIGDIVYKTIGNKKLALDAYVPAIRLGGPVSWVRYTDTLKPALLFLHGGGWTSGSKVSRSLFVMPFVQAGYIVVTSDYRHLPEASLPEIISDTRAAIRWIYLNSDKYKIDTNRIFVSGESAGGHLALMDGALSESDLFPPDSTPLNRKLKVAGVINWFGVADLVHASETWDQTYKNIVAGKDSLDPIPLFKKCSPVTYINKNTVPILTIHGSEDKAANYDQAILLNKLLDSLGTKHTFWTIQGKKHGDFSPIEMTEATQQIWKFIHSIQ
ncbi:MAG: alpha/beta hydrolase [Saprospiraceae bacterium]